MSVPNPERKFVFGRRYRNGIGRFKVLSIEEPNMRVEYENGTKVTLTVLVQELEVFGHPNSAEKETFDWDLAILEDGPHSHGSSNAGVCPECARRYHY